MVRKVVKISITVPIPLLEEIKQEAQDGETRSEAITRLLKFALRTQREKRDVERYIQGYLEQPETEEEMLIAHAWGIEALRSEPWQ